MSEIGEILREARESRGLTLDDTFDTLRIQPKYLSALETGEYQVFPSTTHVRGYLRKYARFLSLDPSPILERLDTSQVGTWDNDPTVQMAPVPDMRQIPTLPPEPETGTFFTSMNRELAPQEEETDWVGRLIIMALIVAIALVGWRLFPYFMGDRVIGVSNNGVEQLNAAVQQILGNEPALADEEALDMVEASTSSDTLVTSELIVPTTRTNGGTAVEGSSSGSAASSAATGPEPTPTRNPLPATLNEINMVVEVIQNQTWMRITVDDTVLFEGTSQKGEIFEYSTGGKVNIRTGNGAGLLVTINEISLGQLGARGEVVDRVWETTQ